MVRYVEQIPSGVAAVNLVREASALLIESGGNNDVKNFAFKTEYSSYRQSTIDLSWREIGHNWSRASSPLPNIIRFDNKIRQYDANYVWLFISGPNYIRRFERSNYVKAT